MEKNQVSINLEAHFYNCCYKNVCMLPGMKNNQVLLTYDPINYSNDWTGTICSPLH